MEIKQNDIEEYVLSYASSIEPYSRYASFDYCYNYFRKTDDLTIDLEKSCLVLGFYLASWGMFRGSSFILQKSLKHFKSTINYINSLPKAAWEIDVPYYNKDNIGIIKAIYDEIQSCLIPMSKQHLTLVTKILLGVFGFIPAFDDLFCQSFREIFNGTCGFRVVNDHSLNCIKQFYDSNSESIEKLSSEIYTINFYDGQETDINYPKAKIIDMYAWQKKVSNP